MIKEKQAENAIKWIEALLSGKYKQRKQRLGEEINGFCCWGLGCKILNIDYCSNQGWNDDLYRYIGFNNQYGKINPYFYNRKSLAGVNDYTNAGFKRIGKYLIKHANTNFNSHVANTIQKHFNNKL